MQCFRNFPVAKKYLDKGGERYHDFPSKIFFSQCRKVSQWNFLLLYEFQVSKNVRDKRRGETQYFVEKFSSPSAEKFVEEPFCSVFQSFSGSEKVYG